MKSISVITDSIHLDKQFKRCCEQYSKLQMFTAWVGNPNSLVPFNYLESISDLSVVVGVSFFQSNPEGLKFLNELDPNMRIAKNNILFHPKVYLFSDANGRALIIGSSNFTYSGFYHNEEANVLIEGSNEEINQIFNEEKFNLWQADSNSFTPDDQWHIQYTKQYDARLKKLKLLKLLDETQYEDENINNASWLSVATWDVYLLHIKEGIEKNYGAYTEELNKKLTMLMECRTTFPQPWRASYFDTIEQRRVILGKRQYGWLGHIGASGNVQKLFANGTASQKNKIVRSLTVIGSLTLPVNWQLLSIELQKLVEIGPTIKVWGRLLAITRPDLFCTVSSDNVRLTLSKLLEKPQSFFKTVDGYIALQKKIHSSPWYNRPEPTNDFEKQIWLNRAALLDVVFY